MRYTRTIPAPPSRPAFTLVEIMVVIVIIVILVSLTAGSYFYFIGGQQGHNTEGTIRATYKVLQGQWSWVVEDAKKENISGIPALTAMAGNDPTGERTRLIWIKARLTEAFPMTFNEALNPPSIIPASRQKYLAAYTRAINGRTAPGNTQAGTQASACLLMALSVSRGGRSLSPDEIRGFVADTDNDGMSEIIDGWGTPLTFDRFGVSEPGLQALNPAPAGSKQALFADPLDPSGLLLNPSWYNSPLRPSYEGMASPTATYTISSTNGSSANYVIPVIASAGPDKSLTATTDNIYSFNLR